MLSCYLQTNDLIEVGTETDDVKFQSHFQNQEQDRVVEHIYNNLKELKT